MKKEVQNPEGEWGRSLSGRLYEKWPRDEEGKTEPPVYLCHCTGLDMDDVMLITRLETFGIPVLRQYPNDGSLGRVVLGMSGSGVDLFVPASLWADATELLKEPEEDEAIE